MRGCVPKKLLVYGAQFADAFADAAGYGWNVPVAEHRLAEPDRRQEQRARPAGADLSQDPEERQSRADRGARHRRRSAHDRGRRPHLHRRQDHDRRRRPSDGAGHSRHRACNLLERGARVAEPAAPHRHRRRRLYRGRVRRHLQRASAPRSSRSSGARRCSTASTTMCGWPGQEMRTRGINIRTRTQIARIEKSPRRRLHGRSPPTAGEISADLVMYATGRKPNTRGLGLAEAGVELQRRRARSWSTNGRAPACRTSTRSAT